MREVKYSEITNHVAQLCQEANFNIGDDVILALQKAITSENSPIAIDVLNQIIENARIAREECVPMCQDCGVAVFFIEIGQDVHVIGGDINEAINEGVRIGYSKGYLRKSMVASPLRRVNTGDNTPPVVHFKIVPGDKIRIVCAPKGAGSENMSKLKMLKPSDGIVGVKKFVIAEIKKAGGNPCPPSVIGIGIGGGADLALYLGKKALIRPVGERHKDKKIAAFELDLIKQINKSGIGPMGLGGKTTVLDVHVEKAHRHPASLPVGLIVQCWANRRATARIYANGKVEYL